ncbi:hypothetical protein TRSC58_04370 [Trypanosoma rangeli SC58]|uniref:Uncharacterized protein n=1 Tax=Trypanosoma rangeli SC58 TaxID=429131 RepID=A0A061J1C2_TRYRA|nr:hypothetical protein TRSC58_04370 [Trypanosoma rangeli SC58]
MFVCVCVYAHVPILMFLICGSFPSEVTAKRRSVFTFIALPASHCFECIGSNTINMWRRGQWLRAPPKVLCLTMVPGGGAMTRVLQQLGYTPYTFWHTFTGGRVTTHPQEWCMVLDKKKTFNPAMLDGSGRESSGCSRGFDALVGPPCSLAFEAILKECPLSTRVILVEELDKDAWAIDAATIWNPLLRQTEKAARRQAGVHLHQMVLKMTMGMTGSTRKISSATTLDMLEERVKAVVPKDRLLVYHYGSGWEPLCHFLSKPVPQLSDTGVVPFPPLESGRDVAADLSYRLQRVERVVLWVTCFLVAALVVLYTPLYTQLRACVAEYYEDYREAFEPVLRETDGNTISLRQALVLAKNTTMSFEEKWRARGGVAGAAGEALSKLADSGDKENEAG